ncbi:MAG: tryptophan-rich sensory protein [Candidatus Sumerlaeia bacterium]|nr:tryptophan-rich sensory protein [Candidatus Sumerlaeia bacterium]
MKPWIALAGFVAVCFVPAVLGAFFTSTSVATWYPALRKPAWTPPGWVFGPVWTALYLSMAVAAWIVWRERGLAGAKTAMVFFAVQLALNAAWSPLFFGLKHPAAALIDVVLLWTFIAATIISFWQIKPPAAILLLPYWVWVGFATGLNYAIWRMN